MNIDFHFIGQHYSFIFFLAIITFAVAILLKSAKLFIAQLFLLLSISLLHGGIHMILPLFIGTIQLSLSGFIFFRLKKAVDRNYQLVMEKTHQAPRHFTKTDNGTQRSFL